MKTSTFIVAAAAALCLLGCATPQVALDQANNGAALVAQLELELQEFRRVQQGFSNEAKKSLRDMDVAVLTEDKETTASMRARRAAEDPVVPKLYDTVRGLADGVGTDESNLTSEIAALDERLSKILKPLPSTTEKTSGAQKALVAMGTELSNKERLAEIQDFYKKVKAGVDANKKKIKDAEGNK